MKTDDLLNLDCEKEENKQTINRFLWKIKPCAKLLEKNQYTKTEYAPIEILEKVLHGFYKRYNFKIQSMFPYYEEGRFIFYNISILQKTDNTNEWKGNVYAKTVWEMYAKALIKMYAEIKKENRKE